MAKIDSVSVLIPCFNRRTYIEKALESVLQQGAPLREIIVVDDGSTDGSYDFLLSYASHGTLKLLTHPQRQNRGQSASLNLALREASGEYVAVLDSDDLFAPKKLASQVEFLERNPEFGMVYGQGNAIDEEGNHIHRLLGKEHEEISDPNRLLLDCYMALPGSALVRKTVWDKVGYFEENFRAAQDHDMALRLMEAAPVAYLPELAFFYRKHGDSISQKGLERRWLTGFEILERARRRYPYRRSTIRKRAAVLNFRLGETYWREGRRLKALPYLLKAGFLHPARALRVLSAREPR